LFLFEEIVIKAKNYMSDMENDKRRTHVWISEPKVSNGCILTSTGADSIAHHKYQPGVYTTLDTILNSFWQSLTDALPITLAPNAVTAMGGSFCLLSYLLTAYYNFNYQQAVPNWVLTVNGVCLFIYYTFDCMDGKQARRTKSSTPLGQLFDHGVDCVSNLSHVSLMASILQLNPVQFMWLQTTLQLGFFQAQWEEYYTGRLPHACGNIGTTEVLYGIAAWTVGNGAGILDRHIYAQTIPSNLSYYLLQLPISSRTLYHEGASEMLYKDLFILFWVYGYLALALGSVFRVIGHVTSPKILASAMTKLISPMSLYVAAIIFVSSMEESSSSASEAGGVRYPSLCIGIVFCLITIKLIVLGMAHMVYASIQLDVLPVVFLVAAHQYSAFATTLLVKRLFALASLLYLFRFVSWTGMAMGQICQRLHIRPFQVVGTKKIS
jgi:phosphatidylglycerophosphate synthase